MNTTKPMKFSQQHQLTLLLVAFSLMATYLAPAASFEWSGASGADDFWSTGANWNPGGPPGSADSPVFGETDTVGDATTVNNIVGPSTTVAALSYTNSLAGTWHVTEISSGSTLTVSGTVIVGGGTVNNLSTAAAMVGGGTFLATGNTFTVGNGGPANPLTPGTLDLSNLTNFIYEASGGTIGIASFGSRGMGTLTLAAVSNSLTAGTININGATGTGSQPKLNLGGGTNIINVNTFNVGGGRSTTTLGFFSGTGGLRLRGTSGTDDSRTTMVVGNRNTGGTGTLTTTGNAFFNGHPVNMKFATLTLGLMSRNGTEANFNGLGNFQFDQGTVDATTIAMGVVSGNSPTSRGTGILTIGAGGDLVAGSVSLANVSSGVAGSGAAGTLNILGGTATVATDIIKTTSTGSTGIINVAESGDLTVQGRIGSPANPINNLNLTNGTLRLNPISDATNVVVTTLATDGPGNTINIGVMPSISSYPVTFRLIKYEGAIDGVGYNFSLSGLPGIYTASLVDNASQSAVDLVITAGPVAQNLTWNGDLSAAWNILGTKNWRLGGSSTNYFDGDFVTFDDTAVGATTVDLTTALLPGSLTVNNSTLSYAFTGTGKIGGLTGLTKQGSGSLVVNNSGVNDFGGPITVSGGTLQVGGGGTGGSLGSGAITMDAGLTFNRSDDTTVPNIISGAASGSLIKTGAGALTLSGANTFTGDVTVVQGTLKAGSVSALGGTEGSTTINSGATLDVNDLNLGLEPIIVSGAGVGGLGAIVENTGAGGFNQANVAFVTLVSDTTFGGTGRWDLRASNTGNPSLAALSTGGQPYKLTKVGPNGVFLPGVTVDPALGDVDIQEGTLAIESATTGIGNPAYTLTVREGATLQLYNMTNLLNKQIVLNGSGTNNTVNNASGNCTVIGPMTLNGDCLFNVGGTSLTLNNTIGGAGSLLKAGGTTLTLTGGPDAYTGNTTVSNGTLVLNTALTGGGTLTTVTGTTLAGNGTNLGPVVVGGTLQPGSILGAGTFTCGPLTLGSGASLTFDLGATSTVGGGVNDLVQVSGNLTASDNAITVNLLQGGLQAGTYRLITYTGTLSGSFNPTVSIAGGASRFLFTLDTTTVGQVNLIVSGNTANLRWNALADNTWDIATTANWFNLGNSQADTFYQADTVLLDDTVGVLTDIQIPASVAVVPTVLTNRSEGNYFAIGGAGKISGGASIVKQGSSTLTLGSANDFTGTVTVEAGTLFVTNNTALGSVDGPTIIKSGATLDIGNPNIAANGVNLGLEPITVSGNGQSDVGAIVNSSALAQQNAIRVVTLAGNTSLGGNARWDIRGAGAALNTGGNAYNITKIGLNQVSLVGVAVDPALGNVDVQSGIFSIETTTSSLGNPARTLSIQYGATLQLYQLAAPLDKVIVLNGDGVTVTYNNSSGNNVIAGPVTLTGACLFNVGGTSLTLNGAVGGAGSIVKNGTSVMTLAAMSPYAGETLVNAGTLALLGTGAMPGSPSITLASTATLDASGRSDGKLSLGNGQTLVGSGTVRGGVQVNPGGTVSPGNDLLGFPVGNLTITDLVTLAGTNVMQTDKSSLTNDLIRGATSIAYGGRLVVSDVFLVPYADGDVFKLFDAGSYSGSFIIEPATPGAGLFWDTSELNTSGTLKVVSTVPPPTITSVTQVGGNLVLAGSGGAPNGPYSVVTATDVALPVTSWSVLGSANFDGNGNFSYPTPISLSTPQRFYLIRVP